MIVRLILNTLAFLFTAYVLREFGLGFYVESLWWGLAAAALLAVANALLKPLLVVISLPLTVLTLGLFTLILNGLLFWAVISIFTPHILVDSFWTALIAALLFSIFSTFFSRMFGK